MTAKPKKPAKKAAKKKKKTKAKMGRPSGYTKALADKICERLSVGESLATICTDKNMPSQSMVFRWLDAKERDDFRESYTRARESQADYHADGMIDLADDVDPGDTAAVNKARLQIDTRKWVAAKQRPTRYGDRQHIEHSIDANTAHILSQGRERANDRKRPKS